MMRVLIFPNSDTIRLTLSVGLIPSTIARRPVRASAPGRERILVEVREDDFAPDGLAALHRLGVQFGVPVRQLELRPYLCWAELLPLQPHPSPTPPGTPILLAVPDASLAGLLATVQRLRPQTVRVLLTSDAEQEPWAWVLLDDPLAIVVPPEGICCRRYRQWQPHGYILEGWEHPLGNIPPLPEAEIWLLHPDRPWGRLPAREFVSTPQWLPVSHSRPPTPPLPVPVSPPPTVPLRLTLTADTASETRESLWMFDGTQRTVLDDILKHCDERLLTFYQTMSLLSPDGQRWILVLSRPGEPAQPLFAGVRGYAPHPVLTQLFLPTGQRLRPEPRPDQLAQWLQLRADRYTWLTRDATGAFCAQSVPCSAFVPLTAQIVHTIRPPVAYSPPIAPASLGVLPCVTLAVEADTGSGTDSGNPRNWSQGRTRSASRLGNWLSQSIGHWLRRREQTPRHPEHQSTQNPPEQIEFRKNDEEYTERTRLRGASDWTAQRLALERRALALIPQSTVETRGALWAELGRVYTLLGNPTDGAICQLSAVWEDSTPPAAWWEEWFRAEGKAARVGSQEPAAFLSGPPDVQSARLAAAYLSWWEGTQSTGEVDFELVEMLLARIDQFEQDLPIKAIWLARLAAARLAGGDPLSLARCRDRIFARLAAAGPELELDLPSFLRFQGHAESERFQIARDWLVRIREPLHRWIARQGTSTRTPGSGRLQWAGLDAEVTGTTAIADLMLAWGLSTLGDRTHSRQFLAQSAAVLRASDGTTNAITAVWLHLLTRFQRRIDAAQSGRDEPFVPEEPAGESDLARYAVDKLVARTRSLDPRAARNPYRGRDLFLGHDALGSALHSWLDQRNAPQEFPFDPLLEQTARTPTPEVLPRLILALLDAPECLTTTAAEKALQLVVPALELMPTWLHQAASDQPMEEMQLRYSTQIVRTAAQLCVQFHQPIVMERLLNYLLTGLADRNVAHPIIWRSGQSFFRAIRKLGLVPRFDAAIRQLSASAPRGSPESLSAAMGWFVLGDDTAGTRRLDAVRERLFVSGIPKLRERTTLALQYAAALGYAPQPIALGRLEELIVRLDTLETQGATNRYFTLQPLILVDTLVNAAIGDDPELGSAVRRWLDDEEFLIRRRIAHDLTTQLAGNSHGCGFSRGGGIVR